MALLDFQMISFYFSQANIWNYSYPTLVAHSVDDALLLNLPFILYPMMALWSRRGQGGVS